MKKLLKIFFITFGVITTTACSDSQSPSISNYESVIKKSMEKEDDFPHCFFRYNFPIKQNGMQLKMSGLKSQLMLLSELGLVEHHMSGKQDKWNLRKSIHDFKLTDKGNQYYIQDRGICIGKAVFVKVRDVSEPYEERGRTYVRGFYEWTVELPEWAMEPKFYDSEVFSGMYYFKFKKLLKNENRETHFVLTLKDHGWDF